VNVAARPTSGLPRLIDKPCWSFNPDGTVMDLAAPDQAIVCFHEMAGTLSRIARFNGRARGLAYSDAQHSVMGAVAVLNEGGSNRDAALFLLHDGHEWALGDITRPVEALFCGMLPSLALKAAIELAKSGWDEAIYRAAGLPGPSLWTAREKKLVKSMDDRMCAAESIALFGARAGRQFPAYIETRDKPRTQGAIRPWGAALAEEQFITLLNRLIGEERVVSQAAVAAAARALR
jgi:5'-deoxynucleotidase YfbR-like HD superfamily hydrolase